MKLIIDIPEEAYKTIMNTSFVRDVDLTFKQSAKDIEQTNAIFSLIDALDNGTPIPDNATNGDVIKAMFPNGTTAKFATFMRFIDGEYYFNCSEEWWHEPYQKGGKDV